MPKNNSKFTDNPKVSICVPTFNRANYILKTLDTLLNQTFSNLEILVCDDGSKDNTADLVSCLKDKRLRFVRNSNNLGLYQNWNRCITLANGDYIGIYHDHDLYESTLVEESVYAMRSKNRIGFVFTGIHFINDNGAILETIIEKKWNGYIPGRKLARHMANRSDSLIAAPTVMVRREAYESVGLYNPKFGFGADLDMWIRLLLRYDAYYINKPMARLRVRTLDSPVEIQFGWKDVIGGSEMIKINIARVYQYSRIRLLWERIKWHFKQDYQFLKYLALCIVKGKQEFISEGKHVIKERSMLLTKILSFLLLNPVIKPLLIKIGVPLFHLFSRTRKFFYKMIIWQRV